jgi:chromosome segregation protein
MLKALELIGFKSFADRTRFEFPAGITVVVGPNGSGKSNIVDGIKWVLGEQSAKSLRGQDMADVIFKGNGTGGRKPANTAEATLIVDNAQGALPIDAPEVHITRRVYRSGEGEYLINGKPCRLKDIRDLCRGTGIGVDAYSLIEQGKVDRLLQASPKDRRAIFEEAAGISRFKAKKVEAQRRLERVEQNLLRLSDIVEEVDSRLRSVRAQAAKAQRYREYSDRLQQLRTQVAYTDWKRLTEKLQAMETQLAELRQQAATAATAAAQADVRVREMDARLEQASEELRDQEHELARQREQIAARQSTIDSERGRCHDFAEEAHRRQRQIRALSGRAGDLQQRLREIRSDEAHAEAEFAEIRELAAAREQKASQLTAELDRARSHNEARRAQYVDRVREAALVGNRAEALESERGAAQAAAERAQRGLRELDQVFSRQAATLDESRTAEQQLTQEANEKAAAVEAAELELAENRRLLARRQEELAVLQGKHTGASQRAKVLEDLERQHAGLGTGVQEVLASVAEHPGNDGTEVHGLVADLIEAGVEIAPLVDVALGDAVQHLVITGERLLRQIETAQLRPQGRVGFIRLDLLAAATGFAGPLGAGPGGRGELQGRPGVIGRADRLVRARDRFQPLVHHLLGDTWFVETLSDALALGRSAGRGLRFVTSRGELLEPDGTLIVGTPQTALGLVSRRSELRSLHSELVDLQRRITQFLQETSRLQENIERQERRNKQLADAAKKLNAALSDQRVRTRTLQDRHEQLQQQRQTLAAESAAAQARQQSTIRELEAARAGLAEAETALATIEAAIRAGERQAEELQATLQGQAREALAAKVQLAKSEQRLEGLRSQAHQCETDRRERTKALTEENSLLEQARQRQTQAELNILRAESQLADLHLRQEQLAHAVAGHVEQRRQLTGERSAVLNEQDEVRRQLRRIEEQQHQLELAAGDVQHERNTLADRLRDDYGIEIAQIVQQQSPEDEQRRAEVEAEIIDLRNKINRIGAVNLDALQELDELEQRFQSLSGQFQDLTQAKESLERIIQKINADSRRLFLETLEAIRANFQVLYRKAFGGGHADIVLEEGKDVLDCGVDILATPPGKPSFNNSLLSGGEKALTAVALLLAIFQFRPSPFCILDEVDAPFDEANIGRFISVLKDFLEWTKFVIVTHSKKTMAAATTIYGITMQESGVSKRVSVRFEDVSEDGHISQEAVDRSEPPAPEEQAA